jgi:lantibiotic modifying enzyme
MSPEIGKYLDAARRIAEMLSETAIWDDDGHACNWIAASPLPGNPTLRPLGFDLYNGLGGVAFFLAGAYTVFGVQKYRDTSVAALRTAHLQAQARPFSPADLSIFEGRFGLHFVTGQISRMLDVPASDATLNEVLGLLTQASSLPHSLDIMGGSAGTICGILSFEPRGFQPYLSPLAWWLGEEILSRADKTGGRYGWLPTDISGAVTGSIPLCGLSHGASGMAATLMRLFERSGRDEFLAGARSAFSYEEHAFDPKLGSWPDLRSPDIGAADTAERGFDAWCHGAGGIAIARLQAMRSDTELKDHHRAVATTALERTHDALRAALDAFERDDGLCHGVVGLAEVCRIGGSVLAVPTFSTEVDEAAGAVADKINALGELRDWPGDLLTTPGLMLGASGIGYSLMSFAGARLPSVVSLFEALA